MSSLSAARPQPTTTSTLQQTVYAPYYMPNLAPDVTGTGQQPTQPNVFGTTSVPALNPIGSQPIGPAPNVFGNTPPSMHNSSAQPSMSQHPTNTNMGGSISFNCPTVHPFMFQPPQHKVMKGDVICFVYQGLMIC